MVATPEPNTCGVSSVVRFKDLSVGVRLLLITMFSIPIVFYVPFFVPVPDVVLYLVAGPEMGIIFFFLILLGVYLGCRHAPAQRITFRDLSPGIITLFVAPIIVLMLFILIFSGIL